MRIRRSIIVLCEDMECKFKQQSRGLYKLKDECSLEMNTAALCFKKYGMTTCEIGCGECKADDSDAQNNRIIALMKYKGVV